MAWFGSCASAKVVQYVIIASKIHSSLIFLFLSTRIPQSFFSFVFYLAVFLLVLMGDFNFTDRTWEYHTAVTSKSGKFLKYAEDNLYSQVLSEPTRKDPLLNLLFINKEGTFERYDGKWLPLPQDHEMGNFKIFYVMRKMVSKVDTWISIELILGDSVSLVTSMLLLECWPVFRKHLLKAQEQVISLCWKSNKPCKRPA